MAFTAVSGDIPLQPGTQAYNFWASGAITKGQGVTAIDWSPSGEQVYVGVPPTSSNILVGVAAYTVASGDPVAIYGPGNLVACKLSGSQSAGTLVGLYLGGMLHNLVAKPKCAVVTKGVTSSGDGEVLIIGNVTYA